MKTVLEVITSTTDFFAKKGVENARLNIQHLLAHVLGLNRTELYMQFDRVLEEKELVPLRDLVKRRAAGEPLQHLLGTIEFLGRTFLCDKRALVPRPETEQLCEMVLAPWKEPKFSGRALDVGTGSGVIALTLAGAWPEAAVEAVDISEDALSLAAENARRLGLEARVQFHRGDLLAGLDGEFGLMVANLPYIGADELEELSPEVRHDPKTALAGGASGSEIVVRLIDAATSCLRGMLALEIGHDQAETIRAELARQNYQDIRIVADYQGRQRFVFAHYHG